MNYQYKIIIIKPLSTNLLNITLQTILQFSENLFTNYENHILTSSKKALNAIKLSKCLISIKHQLIKILLAR